MNNKSYCGKKHMTFFPGCSPESGKTHKNTLDLNQRVLQFLIFTQYCNLLTLAIEHIPEQCSCHSIDHIAVTHQLGNTKVKRQFQFKAYNERQTQKCPGVSIKCQQTYNKFLCAHGHCWVKTNSFSNCFGEN